jgi:hypothetical protein
MFKSAKKRIADYLIKIGVDFHEFDKDMEFRQQNNKPKDEKHII